ncbi:MAG: hypothetical protein NTU89_00660 [Candidatus Dependentiae bacterium]|nr:hypothetical protein [Candidatus Dependentiae bacterium]
MNKNYRLLFFLSVGQSIFCSQTTSNQREYIIHPLIQQFYKDFQAGVRALTNAKNKESTTQTRKNINHIKSILAATPVCWQRSITITDSCILSQLIEQANQIKITLLIEAFCASQHQQKKILLEPLEDLTYPETPHASSVVNSSVAHSSVGNESIGVSSAVSSLESCIQNNSASMKRSSKWAELREDIKHFKKKIPRSAFDDLTSDESDPEDF